MAQQHIFFQNIGQPQQQAPAVELNYVYNCMVLEMASNWPWVRWMINKYRNNDLKVDFVEKEWLNFVLQNYINVEDFGEDETKFIERYYKKPA